VDTARWWWLRSENNAKHFNSLIKSMNDVARQRGGSRAAIVTRFTRGGGGRDLIHLLSTPCPRTEYLLFLGNEIELRKEERNVEGQRKYNIY
jgi:hypothetical protein